MSRANGLVVIPEDTKGVNKGEVVQVIMLDWNEEVSLLQD
jgi:molybdopterin biosynthesis enzyme